MIIFMTKQGRRSAPEAVIVFSKWNQHVAGSCYSSNEFDSIYASYKVGVTDPRAHTNY